MSPSPAARPTASRLVDAARTSRAASGAFASTVHASERGLLCAPTAPTLPPDQRACMLAAGDESTRTDAQGGGGSPA
eukprot:4706084-Prymnesium_polylepis.1